MFRPLLRFLSTRVRFVALGLAWPLAQASPGCVPADDACERSRSCPPSGGAHGIVEQWSGGSAGDGEATGASAGAAGEGGLGGWGGQSPAPPGMSEGDECSPHGRYACAGHATQTQLVCIHGTFAPYGICPAEQRCDTRPETEGLCQPIVAECEDRAPYEVICRGKERLICGPDLVTAEVLSTCPGGCVNGQCTECAPDTEPACEFNSRRACSAIGRWEITSCPADTPHCASGACTVPPSCLALDDTCGKDANENCCTSPVVPGGTFHRNNDPAKPATVSPFRLDRFEVTVGRFRAFKQAWDDGWRPDGGAGKHVHVHGGLGLALPNNPETYEPGWQESLVPSVAITDISLTSADPSADPYATWTPEAGDNETKPINFVSTPEAFVFCVWDGGFLPSDAEWSFAATGGSEQRVFPWGDDAPAANFDLAVYGCFFPTAGTCTGAESIAPVGTAQGVGAFGQQDLAGNQAEWTFGSGGSPCVDCGTTSFVVGGGGGSVPRRGGAFDSNPTYLENASGTLGSSPSAVGTHNTGLRCARVP